MPGSSVHMSSPLQQGLGEIKAGVREEPPGNLPSVKTRGDQILSEAGPHYCPEGSEIFLERTRFPDLLHVADAVLTDRPPSLKFLWLGLFFYSLMVWNRA